MRRTLVTLLMLGLMGLSSARAAEVDFGCYGIVKLNSAKLPAQMVVEKAENSEIYKTMENSPAYYWIDAPKGEYSIVVHYLAPGDGAKTAAFFSVEIDGREVVGRTLCFVNSKTPPAKVEARSVKAAVKLEKGPLKIRFPRAFDQEYAICGVEVLGDSLELRINSGSSQDYTDPAGRLWWADRLLPMPEAKIALDPNDKVNEWVEISAEMLDKLVAAGIEPLIKWKGNYTRHTNGMFYDRSGRIYMNFSGVGLWTYGGPGGTLERADGGVYTSVAKGESMNPYGPGFVLFCSHGFNPTKTYQGLCWDGKTIETWPLDADYGAVDWSSPGRIKPILSKPRHNTILIYSEDAGKNSKEVVKNPRIVNLGALGEGVLVYCLGGSTADASDGIYRSADKGATWEKVSDVNVWGAENCSTIFAYKERAYLHSPAGLLKSADRGKTWRLIPDSPAFTFSVQAGADDTHLLGLSREGVYESKDQGETWAKTAPSPPLAEKQKWIQSHNYYDFAWDHANNVVYVSAPDAAYRFVRR